MSPFYLIVEIQMSTLLNLLNLKIKQNIIIYLYNIYNNIYYYITYYYIIYVIIYNIYNKVCIYYIYTLTS